MPDIFLILISENCTCLPGVKLNFFGHLHGGRVNLKVRSPKTKLTGQIGSINTNNSNFTLARWRVGSKIYSPDGKVTRPGRVGEWNLHPCLLFMNTVILLVFVSFSDNDEEEQCATELKNTTEPATDK